MLAHGEGGAHTWPCRIPFSTHFIQSERLARMSQSIVSPGVVTGTHTLAVHHRQTTPRGAFLRL